MTINEPAHWVIDDLSMKAEALLKLAQRFELQPLLRLCQDSIVPWTPVRLVRLVHGHGKSREVT